MQPVRLAVFRYVIARFGKLRNQWLLTQLFDIALAQLTLMTSPQVTIAIAKSSHQILQWPGVTRSRHPLGGRQFNLRGVELGHIHSNGVADIRLTRLEHDDVLRRNLAWPHHVAPQSTWATYYINEVDDAERVAALFRVPFERLTGRDPLDAATTEDG